MILSSNGQNIFPEEIESKLNNMPFVLESLIIEGFGAGISGFQSISNYEGMGYAEAKERRRRGNLSACPTTISSRNILKHPAKNCSKQSK